MCAAIYRSTTVKTTSLANNSKNIPRHFNTLHIWHLKWSICCHPSSWCQVLSGNRINSIFVKLPKRKTSRWKKRTPNMGPGQHQAHKMDWWMLSLPLAVTVGSCSLEKIFSSLVMQWGPGPDMLGRSPQMYLMKLPLRKQSIQKRR